MSVFTYFRADQAAERIVMNAYRRAMHGFDRYDATVRARDESVRDGLGIPEAAAFVRKVDFPSSTLAFDAAFDKKNQ